MAAVACAGVTIAASSARAERTYRVRIESDPGGAAVATEAGEVLGETPFSGTLAGGRHTVIVSLPGYEPGVLVVRVRKRRRLQTFRITLEKLPTGTISVTLPAQVAAATVWVDGDAAGDAPGDLEIPAGPHQVEVKADGYETFASWIQVVPGESVAIAATLEPTPGATVKAATDPEQPAVKHHPAPAGARDPVIIRAGAGIEIGGRKFSYGAPATDNLRPYDAGGVPRLRIGVDVFPLAPTDNLWARGIALSARFAIAPTIESSTAAGQTADTSWSGFGIGARAMFPVGETLLAGGRIGYGRERFRFSESSPLYAEIPTVDYRSVHVGGLLGARFGDFGVRAGASYLMVLSAGELADRFRDASVSGMRAEVAGTWRFAARWRVALTLAYARYGYDFTVDPGDAYQAASAADQFFGVTAGAAYLY